MLHFRAKFNAKHQSRRPKSILGKHFLRYYFYHAFVVDSMPNPPLYFSQSFLNSPTLMKAFDASIEVKGETLQFSFYSILTVKGEHAFAAVTKAPP